MSLAINKPGNLNIKPSFPDENPYELSSPVALDPESMEMRNHLKFTQLPQDPPPPAPAPRQRMRETDLSTGQAVSPTYKNPPAYNDRPHHHGHHFYEEVNQAALRRKDPSKDSEYGSPTSLSRSHTEVDQAMLFPQSSTTNSLAPLTEPERKPRKKVNPLYDSYRDENGTLDTKVAPTYDQGASKPKGPGGRIGSVLRHPCTIVFIFAFIIALIVFLVLLSLGTITTTGLRAGKTEPLIQPSNATEVEQLRDTVKLQNNLIVEMMSKIQRLESAIYSPTSENASLDIRVAQNSFKIMTLNGSVNNLGQEVTQVNTKAEVAYEQSSSIISTLVAVLNRVTMLENQTHTLNGQVNSLGGSLQTHSMDIVSIQADNQQQENDISMLSSRISVVQQEFSSELAVYNDTIFEELDRISKMQGPRGFNGSDGSDGSGDLSLCVYDVASKGSGVSGTTSTATVSAGANEVITGVSCSTLNGERALLRTNNNPQTFYCECSGVNPSSATTRFCYIHFWKCPL